MKMVYQVVLNLGYDGETVQYTTLSQENAKAKRDELAALHPDWDADLEINEYPLDC